MSFARAVATCLGKYATFAGRASRAEYWWFFLFGFLCSLVAGLLDAAAGTQLAGSLVGLATLLPSLAVAARRLHDRDRSGWWLLVALVPLVGLVVLLVMLARRGTPGPNRFGASPPAVAG